MIHEKTRFCPLCGNRLIRELLFQYTLTNGAEQRIWACADGMIYSESDALPVDYAAASIYDRPAAVGSAVNPHDRERLAGVADTIKRYGFPTDARILDFGCAGGGLLDALQNLGYTNLTGYDLSLACCYAVEQKGYKVIREGETGPEHGFDLIILSHVLEHVRDPRDILQTLMRFLDWSGNIYIEVPDAHRYRMSFLDFNSEHINHFDVCSLKRTLESVGLFGGTIQEKFIHLNDGSSYPALWTITRRSRTAIHVADYIEASKAALLRCRAKLLSDLAGCDRIILWGAGEYLAHILPLLDEIDILAIVDSNPMLHGRVIAGTAVDHPSHILRLPNAPIVISAIIAAPAIRLAAEKMQIHNRIIELEIK